MRLLQRNAKVATRFGGGFVQSIDGLAGGRSAGRQLDWFYYVNGVEASRGAAATRLRGGDRVWWDRHDWSAAMRVPAVVGSFPEPFVHGIDGKRLPVRVECAAPGSAPCRQVSQRLASYACPSPPVACSPRTSSRRCASSSARGPRSATITRSTSSSAGRRPAASTRGSSTAAARSRRSTHAGDRADAPRGRRPGGRHRSGRRAPDVGGDRHRRRGRGGRRRVPSRKARSPSASRWRSATTCPLRCRWRDELSPAGQPAACGARGGRRRLLRGAGRLRARVRASARRSAPWPPPPWAPRPRPAWGARWPAARATRCRWRWWSRSSTRSSCATG